MIKQERIDTISTMRVIAMTMIVAYHSLYFYTGVWWQFQSTVVPLWVKCSKFLDYIDLSMFVFISGFLYGWLYLYKGKYQNKTKFIIGKARRLLIPYIVWGVSMILLQPSIHNWISLSTGISHLWFLLMLFWIFCISTVLLRKKTENASPLKMPLIILLSYLIWLITHTYSNHHYFLCIEASLSYLPSFVLGYFCAQKKIQQNSNSIFKILLSLSILVFTIYIFLCPELPNIGNDLLIRLLSYTIIVSLFVELNRIRLTRFSTKIITKLDKLSMGVYIFNPIIIIYILLNTTAKEWLTIHYMMGPFVIFMASLIIPLCLSYVFNRYKWLSWTIGS